MKFWAENAAGIQAQLDALKVKPADAPAEAFGNLTNADGGHGTKAKALSMLVMPIAITILFKFGFTMALHYVFRPSHRKAVTVPPSCTPGATVLANVTDADLVTVRQNFIGEPPDRPRDGGVRTVRKPDSPLPPVGGGMSKQDVLDYVLAGLDNGRTVPSQQALAGLSGARKQRGVGMDDGVGGGQSDPGPYHPRALQEPDCGRLTITARR